MPEAIIKCIKCEKENELFKFKIDESANLTCPVCSTQFEISAAIKNKVDADAGRMPGLQQPPIVPGAPATPPSRPMAAPPAVGSAPPIEHKFDVDNLFMQLNDGTPMDLALSKFLGEQNKKGVWNGTLADFNTKIQSLVSDLDYSGDLGDLVGELQEGKALKIKGNSIELNCEKAKSVLLKHFITSNSLTGGVQMSGDLLDIDGVELDDIGGNTKKVKEPEIEKALSTYFS